jgi:hypothetical protein
MKHEIKGDFKTTTLVGSLDFVVSSIPDKKHKVNTLDTQMKDELITNQLSLQNLKKGSF